MLRYKSVGNEPIASLENKIVNGGHSQGIPLTSDSSKKANLKYSQTTENVSISDFRRYKHISYVNPINRIIIGTDDRIKVSTNEFPYNVICLLLITDHLNVDYFGTGFFISERCIITAGHCVFFKNRWVKQIRVIPGAQGDIPYGYAISKRFRSVQGWIDNDKRFDHGAIILDDNTLFNTLNSCFGYKPFGDERVIEISGYPLDKNGTQWKSDGKIDSSTAYEIFYKSDTVKGNSGSPVYVNNGNNRIVVGVHTYGDRKNQATRVTQEIINRWTEWSIL